MVNVQLRSVNTVRVAGYIPDSLSPEANVTVTTSAGGRMPLPLQLAVRVPQATAKSHAERNCRVLPVEVISRPEA